MRSDASYPESAVTSVIYEATVNSTNGRVQKYTGLTSKMFKTRFHGHKESFERREKRIATVLLKYIWDLEDAGIARTKS